jgi:hypothetical protein
MFGLTMPTTDIGPRVFRLIVRCRVTTVPGCFESSARSPHDPDLYLVVTFKNMAALDGLDDRLEPIERKVWATRDAANKADADRESMREIIGSQLTRRLNLK